MVATYAPKQSINTVPFFLGAGMVYQGLIPTRDDDKTAIGFYWGVLSRDIDNTTSERILELAYTAQLTPWCYVRPDAQFIFRPGGTGDNADAVVLGGEVGITFDPAASILAPAVGTLDAGLRRVPGKWKAQVSASTRAAGDLPPTFHNAAHGARHAFAFLGIRGRCSGGAMNSGPIGSGTHSATMRSISAMAASSRRQPMTSPTGSSCAGPAGAPQRHAHDPRPVEQPAECQSG